jgi:hypothetical protein
MTTTLSIDRHLIDTDYDDQDHYLDPQQVLETYPSDDAAFTRIAQIASQWNWQYYTDPSEACETGVCITGQEDDEIAGRIMINPSGIDTAADRELVTYIRTVCARELQLDPTHPFFRLDRLGNETADATILRAFRAERVHHDDDERTVLLLCHG